MWLAIVLAGMLTAGEGFAAFWSRMKSSPPEEACAALEEFVASQPLEKDRRLALAKLREVVTKAVPPIEAAEWWEIDRLRSENAERSVVLAGRRAVWIVTPKFAEAAQASGLVRDFDVAYVALRELFGTDPIAARRHRYYVFPNPDRHGVLQINNDSLRISMTWEGRDDANVLEPLEHEVAHAFLADHPAAHLFAGGFAEGWCDFVPAFLGDRLASLGAPYEGRFDVLAASIERGGRDQYLDTRLPIEDIVAYGPSSSVLLALTRTSIASDGSIDWSPWQRLFASSKSDPLPRLGWRWWPARQARDYLAAFGEARARPILRRWRYPVDAVTQAELSARLRPVTSPVESGPAAWKARNDAAGVRTLGDWKVLGPIPDREGRGLEFDPIDAQNFALHEHYDVEGGDSGRASYAWRADVKPDPYGTLYLDTLAGGTERCTFYLSCEWPADAPAPCDLRLSSDDAARVWLDGEEVLRFPSTREIDVFDPTFAVLTPAVGKHSILVQVANDGGRSWFHLAAGTKPTFLDGWKAELSSDDAARRLAAADFLGSRRDASTAIRALLVSALSDSDANVRASAAHALGGHRNDPAAVAALADRWRDPHATAFGAAIGELLLENVADVETARKLWRERGKDFPGACFVECERAVLDWRQSGGFYVTSPNAYGGQGFGREWGGSASDWFAVTLTARDPAPRHLFVRYAQCDRDEAHVSLVLRRAERVVWQSDLALPRSADWSAFAWAEATLSALEPGRYDLTVIATDRSGSADFDVIGWR